MMDGKPLHEKTRRTGDDLPPSAFFVVSVVRPPRTSIVPRGRSSAPRQRPRLAVDQQLPVVDGGAVHAQAAGQERQAARVVALRAEALLQVVRRDRLVP